MVVDIEEEEGGPDALLEQVIDCENGEEVLVLRGKGLFLSSFTDERKKTQKGVGVG